MFAILIQYQTGSESYEVIGPFETQEEAVQWKCDHLSNQGDVDTFPVVSMMSPQQASDYLFRRL